MTHLDVHLYGTHVATLTPTRSGGIELEYTDEARRRWPADCVVLSCSLPLRAGQHDATRFVRNLLPDNETMRAAIGLHHGVDGEDHFGLIGKIGLDCAGAVRIGSPEMLRSPGDGRLDPLSMSDIAELIRSLPRRPIGAAINVRVSVAGNQPKLLLAKTSSGWALPLDGAPSTHIFKPEPADMVAGYAANEAFCMNLSKACGLTTVAADVVSVRGWDTYVVERYDRTIGADGRVERIHQEDFCQIANRRGSDKYEMPGQRRLRDAAKLLERWAPRAELEQVLRHVVFHVIIGNTDAHDKNFSVIHHPNGEVALAPMYDATNTTWKVSTVTEMASSINGVREIDRVTTDDLIEESKSWGLRRGKRVVVEAVELINHQLHEAKLDATIDEEMVDLMKARSERLLT